MPREHYALWLVRLATLVVLTATSSSSSSSALQGNARRPARLSAQEVKKLEHIDNILMKELDVLSHGHHRLHRFVKMKAKDEDAREVVRQRGEESEGDGPDGVQTEGKDDEVSRDALYNEQQQKQRGVGQERKSGDPPLQLNPDTATVSELEREIGNVAKVAAAKEAAEMPEKACGKEMGDYIESMNTVDFEEGQGKESKMETMDSATVEKMLQWIACCKNATTSTGTEAGGRTVDEIPTCSLPALKGASGNPVNPCAKERVKHDEGANKIIEAVCKPGVNVTTAGDMAKTLVDDFGVAGVRKSTPKSTPPDDGKGGAKELPKDEDSEEQHEDRKEDGNGGGKGGGKGESSSKSSSPPPRAYEPPPAVQPGEFMKFAQCCGGKHDKGPCDLLGDGTAQEADEAEAKKKPQGGGGEKDGQSGDGRGGGEGEDIWCGRG